MIWGMTIGTWLYYYALPWSTFVFTVIYGFYWLLSPKYRKDKNPEDDQRDQEEGSGKK